MNVVDVCQSFHDQSQIDKLIYDKLKAGKGLEMCQIIDKYAIYFIEEFKHFLKIHGFAKFAASIHD